LLVDGPHKDFAGADASTTSPAEQTLALKLQELQPAPPATQYTGERTLAGVVIGAGWDMIAGSASGEAQADRAQKADQYAEIAADTIASIPKFSAVTAGVARSLLLIDISGQSSTADVARGAVFNFLQGMALNKVGGLASAEGMIGGAVTSRLGRGLAGEVVTHALSGGGFGLVKSGLSERSWLDGQGNFSLDGGLKNIAAGTTAGALIGIPAGIAGMRMGRAVTLGLGSHVEENILAASVQKFATAGGAGFASGSVFGGIDAAKSGKSISQILDSSLQGGMVGLVTGGFSSGFDHTSALAPIRSGTTSGENVRPLALAETHVTSLSEAHARDQDILGPTEKLLDISKALESPAAMLAAHERLSYKIEAKARVENFATRLGQPVVDMKIDVALKAGAPRTFEDYQTALKNLKPDAEPLDWSKHFYQPFVEITDKPMRVYTVAGHAAKIVVPEEYAKKLDEVRALRIANEKPSVYDRLSQAQRYLASKAMETGDTSALREFMTAEEIKQYSKVHRAGKALQAHPLAARALPEDIVPILDALPHGALLKEVKLLDDRHYGDVYKSALYNAPGFMAAATVGSDGRVELYQPNASTNLYNVLFHEWSHTSKWQAPAYSRLFDLATVVDARGDNVDHEATALARQQDPAHPSVRSFAVYYPDRHSTRSQDENYAVSLGEEMLAPDPTRLFTYVEKAPVRGVLLADALRNHVRVAGDAGASSLSDILEDRAKTASNLAKPYALGTLAYHLEAGSPAEKAAAAHLMGVMATSDQIPDLLSVASDINNAVKPVWEGTAAESAMRSDNRTVSQHAFDAAMQLSGGNERARFDAAMRIFVDNPELRSMAADYALRSSDSRAGAYGPMVKIADLKGSPAQRAAAVEIIKVFGGENKADVLLSIALQKGNDRVPDFNDTDVSPKFFSRSRTVAQQAYDGYLDSSAVKLEDRVNLAFKNGLERPSQRDLAANYLLNHWEKRAQGFGKFLNIYDLPGHVSKMQELIYDNFHNDKEHQQMVYERMIQLTANDQRRQLQIASENLQKSPLLMDNVLGTMNGMLNHGLSDLQRARMRRSLNERRQWDNYPEQARERMTDLLSRIEADAKLQEALSVINRGSGDRVRAVQELTVLHDPRAIKPLLQQAVSGNEAVEEEAIGALRQFSPAMVKFYAQQLKRECYANPVMTGRISNLLSSHRLSFLPIPSASDSASDTRSWQ